MSERSRLHTWRSAGWFLFRATAFRLAHALTQRPPARLEPGQDDVASGEWKVVAKSVSPLYVREGVSATERLWQLGKVENLRRAIRSIHGVTMPPGRMFSFWRQVGPPWAIRGFVVGRELREGCLIPNVGGGLCQLSNALYDCALKAGCEVVERHRHTQVIPGSLAELDRDATVFWNYVDLRFRADREMRISARLTADSLEVTFFAASESKGDPAATDRRVASGAIVENCATCGIEDCIRHTGQGNAWKESVAVIVDRYWPEFDAWLFAQDRSRAHLAVPMRWSRWRRANYRWRDLGWASVREIPLLALRRAWNSRRLAAQGAARQRQLLADDRRVATALVRQIPWRCSRAVVAQTLLPHLSEWLGGRSYGVFLTRLPFRLLHERLDALAIRHPESPTAADFRVSLELVEREWDALERAEFFVTCHSELAEIWPDKTTLLSWKIPEVRSSPRRGKTVVFPASGVARKGAYELREAMRRLDLPLRIAGASQLEGKPDFWSSVRLDPPQTDDWLAEAGVVVLPAWVEHEPRRLLQAAAAGIPVVVTKSCGISHLPESLDITLIDHGDSAALEREIARILVQRVS